MKRVPTTHRVALLSFALAAGLAVANDARAQADSAIQMTPDSRRYLISKDVGNERWAITFNLDDRTASGNVFKTDGSPTSFIWCKITSETPGATPEENQYLLDCFGTGPCESAPCSNAAWTPIGTDLPIQGSFLLPDNTRATFRNDVEPIFNARCALPACHSGPNPQEGLSLEPGQAYDNVFEKPSHQDDDHSLVEPFDLSSSHLYGKILGIEVLDRMPQGGPFLSDEETQGIANWILEGAADN